MLCNALADVYVLQVFDNGYGTFLLASVHANRVSAMMEAMQVFAECNDPHVSRHSSVGWMEDEDGDLTGILDGEPREPFCIIQRVDVRDLQTAVIQRVTAQDLHARAHQEERSRDGHSALVGSGFGRQ